MPILISHEVLRLNPKYFWVLPMLFSYIISPSAYLAGLLWQYCLQLAEEETYSVRSNDFPKVSQFRNWPHYDLNIGTPDSKALFFPDWQLFPVESSTEPLGVHKLGREPKGGTQVCAEPHWVGGRWRHRQMLGLHSLAQGHRHHCVLGKATSLAIIFRAITVLALVGVHDCPLLLATE